jgi:hypothetical protein
MTAGSRMVTLVKVGVARSREGADEATDELAKLASTDDWQGPADGMPTPPYSGLERRPRLPAAAASQLESVDDGGSRATRHDP